MDPFNRVTAIPTSVGSAGDVIFYDGTVFTGDFKAGKGIYYSNGTNWIFMISSNTVGPKFYKAILTQTGTNVPVATVLENSLGDDIVWTRNSTGDYTGTLLGAFTVGKTVFNGVTDFTGDSTLAELFDSGIDSLMWLFKYPVGDGDTVKILSKECNTSASFPNDSVALDFGQHISSIYVEIVVYP